MLLLNKDIQICSFAVVFNYPGNLYLLRWLLCWVWVYTVWVMLVTNKRNHKCHDIYLLDRVGEPGVFSAWGNVLLAVSQVFVNFKYLPCVLFLKTRLNKGEVIVWGFCYLGKLQGIWLLLILDFLIYKISDSYL